jgi:hypothetical protein
MRCVFAVGRPREVVVNTICRRYRGFGQDARGVCRASAERRSETASRKLYAPVKPLVPLSDVQGLRKDCLNIGRRHNHSDASLRLSPAMS